MAGKSRQGAIPAVLSIPAMAQAQKSLKTGVLTH